MESKPKITRYISRQLKWWLGRGRIRPTQGWDWFVLMSTKRHTHSFPMQCEEACPNACSWQTHWLHDPAETLLNWLMSPSVLCCAGQPGGAECCHQCPQHWFQHQLAAGSVSWRWYHPHALENNITVLVYVQQKDTNGNLSRLFLYGCQYCAITMKWQKKK